MKWFNSDQDLEKGAAIVATTPSRIPRVSQQCRINESIPWRGTINCPLLGGETIQVSRDSTQMKGLKHAIHNTDNRRTWSEVSAVLQSDETSSSWWSNSRAAEKISVLGTAGKITSLTTETIQIAWTSHADHAERNHIKKDKPIKTSQSKRWE